MNTITILIISHFPQQNALTLRGLIESFLLELIVFVFCFNGK